MSYKKKIVTGLLALAMISSNFAFSYAEFEDESGKDHIVDVPNIDGISPYVFANYIKSANFYLYNTKVINMYNTTSTSSTPAGSLAPQVLKASKRHGNWFYIDTYAGKKWIYQDSSVELREIEDMNNDEFTTKTSLKLYSQPFTQYPLNISIPAGTYKIVKKSGDWFYINSSQYTGWFTTNSGSFKGGITTLNTSSINSIPLKTKIAPLSNNVRPGYPMKPKYITIHNTANTGKGANASAHANLLYNGNGGRTASWHFTADDKEIYQSLPLNEIGYHAGDGSGPGNRSSIGIEICENSDGNYLKAEQNAAELTAYLLKTLNLPFDAVKKHQDFSGKDCPARILGRSNGWNDFMSKVKTAYNKLPDIKPDPSKEAYYLDINSFVGEANAKSALDKLKAETGWYANYKQMDKKEQLYSIKTGGFVGESNVNNAITTLKNTTGLNGYAKHEGQYSGGSKTPIYRIETGGFIGEEKAKQALEWLQNEIGWYATYQPTGSKPNEYKIVTGGFIGEANAKDALTLLSQKSGWWATYKFTGSYSEIKGTPIYYIYVDGFTSESSAKNALQKLKDGTGWYANSLANGSIYHYQIITGAFVGLENAQKQSQLVKDKFGWYNIVKKK